EPLPWENEPLAAATGTADPPHICIHCHRDPPDGLERVSAYAGAWLHPQCEDAFIRVRMAEEGLAQPEPSPPPPPSPPEPPPSAPTPPPSARTGNGRGSGNGFDRNGSKTEAERDKYVEEHADDPFDDDDLRRVGYRLTRVFDYVLADGTLLYQQNR